MLRLYSVGIIIYGAILRVSSFFVPKAKLLVEGRSRTFNNIQSTLRKHNSAEWIWIHASSLGEFEQGRYLIEQLKSLYPKYKIALSFYSPSGYIPMQHYDKVDIVFYMPLDTYNNGLHLVNALSPKLAIFIKYDFWWNHLKVLQEQNIPTVFVSAMIRSDQYFIKRSLGEIRSILKGVSHYYVQTEESKTILNSIGIHQTTISGDSRLDSILNETQSDFPVFEEISNWTKGRKCIIYGSIHASDLSIIQAMFDIDACHLIVPHDVDDNNCEVIRSAIKSVAIYTESGMGHDDIVILNKTGLLRSIYRFADLVYIGGGFGAGIHNTLEPLVHLKPILIGPRYDKFPEAVELTQKQVITSISTPDQAITLAKSILDENDAQRLQKQQEYIENNSGATQIICRSIEENQWI